jgi:hypothetical protein
LSNMLHNSDAYRKIWQSVSGLSLLTPYSGKAWCWWDFFSFLTNTKDQERIASSVSDCS